MIIGISGKINSGKDTVGKIIQIIKNSPHFTDEAVVGCLDRLIYTDNNFIIKKFADKLKDIVCLLIGCTREQLENREFKEKELGEEWWYYKNYTYDKIIDIDNYNTLNENQKGYWKLVKPTPRLLLQLLGTECGREILHPNIWVNALMSDYIKDSKQWINKSEWDLEVTGKHNPSEDAYPNWIITDTRFPNEAKAIKDRNGILIRVNRKQFVEYEGKIVESFNVHPSESGLDNYKDFDYVIENDETLVDLVSNVKAILQKENII